MPLVRSTLALPSGVNIVGSGTNTITSGSGGLWDGANRAYSLGNKVPVAGLSATGTANSTTYLRGDGTWATVSAAAPSNMLTTDTAQSITGWKTVNAQYLGMGSATATSGSIAPTSSALLWSFSSWNGTSADNGSFQVYASAPSNSPRLTVGALLYENNSRVYSAANTPASIATIEPYIMAVTGTLTAQAGKSRVYLEGNYAIESVRASVGTASAGASVIVDVNINGTSIYGTQANRPTITAGANTALGGTASTATIVTGQYITVDVDQIGTTTAGADLTVVIRLRRTS